MGPWSESTALYPGSRQHLPGPAPGPPTLPLHSQTRQLGSVWFTALPSIANALDGPRTAGGNGDPRPPRGDGRCSGVGAPRPLSLTAPSSSLTAVLPLRPKAQKAPPLRVGGKTEAEFGALPAPTQHLTNFLARGMFPENTEQMEGQVTDRVTGRWVDSLWSGKLRGREGAKCPEAGGGLHPAGAPGKCVAGPCVVLGL